MQWQYEFQFVVCVLSAVRRTTLNYSCTPLPNTIPDNREYALCFTPLKHLHR